MTIAREGRQQNCSRQQRRIDSRVCSVRFDCEVCFNIGRDGGGYIEQLREFFHHQAREIRKTTAAAKEQGEGHRGSRTAEQIKRATEKGGATLNRVRKHGEG